jgi:parallel beta-helix repeat protein
LTLRDAGDGRPTIDAGCSTDVALDVQHRGVLLKGLRVIGPGRYDVNFVGIPSGSVHDVVLRSTCPGAEYGINVYDGGHLDLAGNRATGFSDAGIYVGGIRDTAGGTLTVRGNDLYGNTRGLIVEEALRATDIVVTRNHLHDNTHSGAGARSGIYVNVSDGVVFRHNRVNDNGEYGIQLTSGSDHNRFFDNVARHNPTADFLDDNGANCGAGNTFPLPPC